jgi:predicted CoA-substrate-specific enzyme activase
MEKKFEGNEIKSSFGICMGASTVTGVRLLKDENGFRIDKIIRKPHDGDPKSAFKVLVNEINEEDLIMVTGRKFRNFLNTATITEPEAIEYALGFTVKNGEKFDAVISSGGETFMVYVLDENNRITNISTGNKCASGTGEFFLQQIKRMDLDIEDAVDLASKGEAYRVSGRCSVFCKSDCTHALNKGEPKANVTAGLCEMIAAKIRELLSKVPNKSVMMIGGVALNKIVVNSLKKEIEELVVPEEASYFEALGAAIASMEKGMHIPDNWFNDKHNSFYFLPSLNDAEKYVTFNTMTKSSPKDNDELIIGLDVGSTTTKAVMINDAKELVGSVYIRTNGNPIEASKECYKSLLSQIGKKKVGISGIGVTGSGRYIAGLFSQTDGIINEIIAHAEASVFFDPEVDTIFEIGGQDAKYTHITNGVASDYAMNEACSAGTGSFLEESAYESLGVRLEDIAQKALKAENPPNFSDQCAAFISSDIKNASHEGISHNDILAGLVYSICFNYVNRVKGARPTGNKIFMQGGVCYNRAVPLAMANILRKNIVVPPEPGLMGAFGVALELKKRIGRGQLKKKAFSLEKIIGEKIEYKSMIVCSGGKEKCDIKCQINRLVIDGKMHFFGGACNRYYNVQHNLDFNEQGLDLVEERNRLMFEKYSKPDLLRKSELTIGINTSLLTNRVFPLYYNFFKSLGVKIVMPDKIHEKSIDRQTTSMCYPAEISLGLFGNLLEKKPDFIFMPYVREMYVPGGLDRNNFCATCLMVQGEPFWMSEAFRDVEASKKIISPMINFSGGWENGEKVFVETGMKLGFTKERSLEAFHDGLDAQRAYEKETKEIGKRILSELENDKDMILIVLFGRVYNAYSGYANKGIPKKFSSRNYRIIPYDMLPYEDETLHEDYRDYMHWESGQRILKSAEIVKRHPRMFGVYITNFLCAPDSFLVPYFRRIMGTKPSLTLELDAHTADAGINTRIDAFIDIVNNFKEITVKKDGKKEDYVPAEIVKEKKGYFYIDSYGNKFSIRDRNVKLLLPSMGDLGTTALAHAFNKCDINTIALPVSDKEVLHLGRSVTTGKECLPVIVCVGSLLKYVQENKNPDEKIMFMMPKAGGYCRFGQYHVLINQVIRDKKLRNIAVLSPAMEENYLGLGLDFSLQAWHSIVISDVMADIRDALKALAVDPVGATLIFNAEYEKICKVIDGSIKSSIYGQLEKSVKVFRKIPLKIPFHEAPMVMLTGETFVRRDDFSNLGLARRLVEKGFVVRISPGHEHFYYANFMIKHNLSDPRFNLKEQLNFFVTDIALRFIEKKVKKILVKSGLCEYELTDIEDLVNHIKHITPLSLDGEHHIVGGLTLRDGLSLYSGIINVGPFGCMQLRFADGIVSTQTNIKAKARAYEEAGRTMDLEGFSKNETIPFLTVESDGNPYPQLLEARFENFSLQAARIAKKQGKNITHLKLH